MPTIGQEICLFFEFDLAIRAVLEPRRCSEASELPVLWNPCRGPCGRTSSGNELGALGKPTTSCLATLAQSS
jgi:hypothetical protein